MLATGGGLVPWHVDFVQPDPQREGLAFTTAAMTLGGTDGVTSLLGSARSLSFSLHPFYSFSVCGLSSDTHCILKGE